MKLNRDRDLTPQPPIYGMLSDMGTGLGNFDFISYDGTKFQCMTQISILRSPHTDFMKGMMQVSDLLFSLLLNGYVEILAAVEQHKGNASKHKSFSPGTPIVDTTKALLKAREAQAILVEPDLKSEYRWENDSRHGLRVLNESLRHFVKFGTLEDWDEDNTDVQIGGIMEQVIEEHRSRKKVF